MELVDLSLIRINDESGFISVHRLTQDEYLDHMSEQDYIEVFQVVCRLVCHTFPRRASAGAHHLYHRWQLCEQLIHHVIALQEWYQNMRKMVVVMKNQELTRLMSDAAWLVDVTSLKGRRSQNSFMSYICPCCFVLKTLIAGTWRRQAPSKENWVGVTPWLKWGCPPNNSLS
jgi:hypothetical protein